MRKIVEDREFWATLKGGAAPGPDVVVFSMPEETTSESQSFERLPSSDAFGESLPVSVRVVRTEEHLRKAVRVRSEAFNRHYPLLRDRLAEPEPEDQQRGNVILLAESKLTGAPEGSVRIETNLVKPIEFETALSLPERFHGKALAEVRRLSVRAGPSSRMVKYALFKALYRYCFAVQIDFMMVTAQPPVDKDYTRLGFDDVFERETLIRYPNQSDGYFRLLCMDIASVEGKWRASSHPLHTFMFKIHHPDIEVFSSVQSMWSTPRKQRRQPMFLSPPTAIGIPVV